MGNAGTREYKVDRPKCDTDQLSVRMIHDIYDNTGDSTFDTQIFVKCNTSSEVCRTQIPTQKITNQNTFATAVFDVRCGPYAIAYIKYHMIPTTRAFQIDFRKKIIEFNQTFIFDSSH